MMICHKCHKEFPIRVVLAGKTHMLNKRRFCLECSPFGGKNRRDISDGIEQVCSLCNEFLTEANAYKRKNRWGFFSYCKSCHNKRQKERLRKFKQQCVEYKGGKCKICGYCRCLAALDFHHSDPSQKEFQISHGRFCVFGEKVKLELDKCDLLCANCHRESHAEQDDFFRRSKSP